jgi:PP-loop superfamily ATP-utilizing enzyme
LYLFNRGIDAELNWMKLYSISFKSTTDTKLITLQFKINHNFLATKSVLNIMGITEDNSCTFCKEEREDT